MTDTFSVSPINALQQAEVALLKSDGPLTALLGGRQAVFDQPPEGEAYPYVRVGDHVSTPDNTINGFGREIVETLHVWTRVRSNKPGQDIADRVTALLDHQVATLGALMRPLGHKLVSIRQEFDQALTDPDPELRHHVLRFRVQTAQTT